MDNHGMPAPNNFNIRGYVANQKIQDPSKCWPFEEICEYSRNIDLSCRVPLSNRQGRQIVEAPEPSARRRNTEADNVVDENHRAERRRKRKGKAVAPEIPSDIEMDIPREGETDSDDSADEAERRRKGKAVAQEISSDIEIDIPREGETDSDDSADEAERRRKGKAVAQEISSDIEMDIPREGETDSDDFGEYERQLSVAIHESWESFYNSGLNLSSHALPTVTGPARGAETEYEIQLNFAIQESLKSFNNSGLHLNSHALRTVTGPARGNISNDSVMELTNTSHSPNEDSVDEGAQTEALDAVRGTFINCSSDSDDTGRNISNTEPKKRRLNATIALERSSGSGVRGSLPTEPTSASGQASGANAVGHQTDMVVPILEPMVCVTNRNPMDLTIEEAKKYMRTE